MLSSEYEKGQGDWATDTRGGSEYSYSYLESLEKEDQEDTLSYYYDIEGIINRLTPLYSNMQYEGKQWTVAGFNGQPGLLTGSPDTIYDNLDDGVYIISRLKKDHEGKDPKQFWNRHDIILIKEGSSVEFWSFTPGLVPKTDKNGKIIYVYPTQKEIMKGVPGWIHKGNPLDSQSMNKGDIYKGYVQNKFYSIDITGLRSYLNNATGLNNKNAPIYNPFTYNCQSFAIDTILKYQKNFDIRNYLPFF